jgi:transcriptional regulator with XRE-family HTH domain
MDYGGFLGGKIRRLRVSRQMSQRKLAKLSGLSNGYISRLERGEVGNPGMSVLAMLSNPLGVPVSELAESIEPLDVNAEVIQDMARRIAIILPNVQLDNPEQYLTRTASLPIEGQVLMERLLFTIEDYFRGKLRKERSYELAEADQEARVLGDEDSAPLNGHAITG